jgi:hypothetical protein
MLGVTGTMRISGTATASQLSFDGRKMTVGGTGATGTIVDIQSSSGQVFSVSDSGLTVQGTISVTNRLLVNATEYTGFPYRINVNFTGITSGAVLFGDTYGGTAFPSVYTFDRSGTFTNTFRAEHSNGYYGEWGMANSDMIFVIGTTSIPSHKLSITNAGRLMFVGTASFSGSQASQFWNDPVNGISVRGYSGPGNTYNFSLFSDSGYTLMRANTVSVEFPNTDILINPTKKLYLDGGSNTYVSEVKAGDKILFSKYAGTELKLDGSEYLMMREEDILGVFN